MAEIDEEVATITSQIDSIPAEIIDAENSKKQISRLTEEVFSLNETSTTTQESLKDDVENLEKINGFLASFNVD